MNQIAERITSQVKIPDVLSYYGYPNGRGNRIPCPIHKGKDSNFCYTDEVYHCWTCGASGNVITLVMSLFELNYRQAVLKINNDFQLGLLSKRPTYRERQQWAEKKKVDKSYNEYLNRNKIYYKSISLFHRGVFALVCQGNDSLKPLQERLEFWLDENIEGVMQPW